MSDVSGAMIGGALADMESVTARMDGAGGASLTHAADATATAQVLVDEVSDVTRYLSTTFVSLAETLRREIVTARDSLAVADWSGRSRGAADAAEAELNAQVTSTLDAAQAGVDDLSGMLTRTVLAFHGEVSGQFATVMAAINERYVALGRGTSAFAEGLRQVDQTISYG